MELSPEVVDVELKVYENKLCSADFYQGTPEGNHHAAEATALRACYLRIGILDDEKIAKIARRAHLRARKCRGGMK